MSKSIVVVGWYNVGNLGDEAFKKCIPMILGESYSYIYENEIPANVNNYDLLVIGGGSFLDTPIKGNRNIKIPILFLGVGVHVIHEDNFPLLEASRLVIARNSLNHSPINNNVDNFIVAPDLLYIRSEEIIKYRKGPIPGKVVLVLNNFIIPRETSPDYVFQGWKRFKNEIIPAFEKLFPGLEYVAMQTSVIDDRFIVPELEIPEATEENLCKSLANAQMVFSLRYHGCIYSHILDIPFVGISHHDKMYSWFADRKLNFNLLNYYTMTDQEIFESYSNRRNIYSCRHESLHWPPVIEQIRETYNL